MYMLYQDFLKRKNEFVMERLFNNLEIQEYVSKKLPLEYY